MPTKISPRQTISINRQRRKPRIKYCNPFQGRANLHVGRHEMEQQTSHRELRVSVIREHTGKAEMRSIARR